MPGPSPYPLIGETASTTLDGSGNGTARWTPGAAGAPGSGVGASRYSGYSVDITGVAVSAQPLPGKTAPVNEAQCSIYISYGVQSATPADFQGQTITGSTGDTDSITANLKPQDWITAIWKGGDVGVLATLQVLGTVNPPGST